MEDKIKRVKELEQEIKDKGLVAPRLTPAHIDGCIVKDDYYVFPGTTNTVCLLTLKNGYITIGDSACASPENFDAEIGRKLARDNARNKIWALEGYLLKQNICTQTRSNKMGEIFNQGDVAVLNSAVSDGVVCDGALQITVDRVENGVVYGSDQHGDPVERMEVELTNVANLDTELAGTVSSETETVSPTIGTSEAISPV